ncbi:hypothetical protein C8R43DRAFT_1175048 [Mycena crocata]|nr:hypothetical protein C8R43DRAFT_1175048 [Mycena crocata]
MDSPRPPSPAPPATTPAAQSQNRKRKRATATAASPAPSEPGTGNTAAEVLSSRADLSTRPRLSISRGPNFLPTTEGSEFFKTELTGVNRIGYRYTPAGINPPGHFLPCRTIESNPTSYRISWEDRSSFVQVTKDGLGLSGSTGFRSARCNAPIREGRWYMEVKLVRGGGEHLHEDGKHEGSHVRLGWGRREAPLNGPVGLDGYSYGYRDKTGDKVTLSRPRPYGRPFSSGDVIGMYISLPPKRQADSKDLHDPARIKRELERDGCSYGGLFWKVLHFYVDPIFLQKIASGKLPDRGPSNAPKSNVANLRTLPILPHSHIAFFVNGQCQGIAFQDLYDYLQLRQSDTSRKGKDRKRVREGVKEHIENPFDDGTLGYYPFISLFNEACVRLNPGPVFDFPPPSDIEASLFGTPEANEQTWRPICDRYPEFMAEQWALDAVEEEEASSEAIRTAAFDKAQAEKKAQRNKKRQQTEARKRAKVALETSSAAMTEDDRVGLANNMSGPGQPSPLRHGTAYMPDQTDLTETLDEASFTSVTQLSGPGTPSPLRHTVASVETNTDHKLIVPGAALSGPGTSPSRQRASEGQHATYAYGFPAGFPSPDDSGSTSALLGPTQTSEIWHGISPPYTPFTQALRNSASDEPRLDLLSGPGQPSPAMYAYESSHDSRGIAGQPSSSTPRTNSEYENSPLKDPSNW